jgi:hypothetical protein
MSRKRIAAAERHIFVLSYILNDPASLPPKVNRYEYLGILRLKITEGLIV